MNLEKPTKSKNILESVVKRTGNENFFEQLKSLKRNDLTSLLINLYEEKASAISPAELLKQYETDRFLQPSTVSQRDFNEFDRIYFSTIDPDIETIELSPVAPLGSNSVLTPISQKNVLATARSTEVTADAVTALALECAKRRRKNSEGTGVYLTTSHREIRTQKFDENTGFLPHFRGLSIVSSEKVEANRPEELGRILYKHLRNYLKLLKASSDSELAAISKITVKISSLRILETLIKHQNLAREDIMRNTQNPDYNFFEETRIQLPERLSTDVAISPEQAAKYKIGMIFNYLRDIGDPVIKLLKQEFPNVVFEYDLSRVAGIGYYEDLCFKISGENIDGSEIPLGDGGFTDWTRKILSSKTEKCFAGGLGTELLLSRFKKKT